MSILKESLIKDMAAITKAAERVRGESAYMNDMHAVGWAKEYREYWEYHTISPPPDDYDEAILTVDTRTGSRVTLNTKAIAYGKGFADFVIDKVDLNYNILFYVVDDLFRVIAVSAVWKNA